MKDIAVYVGLTLLLYIIMWKAGSLPSWAALSLNTLLILLFVAVIIRRDLPLKSLPVIGKFFHK